MSRVKLTEEEARSLIREVKRSVESWVAMPAAGEQNKEFNVESSNSEHHYTVALYQGRKNPHRHSISARITVNGVLLLRLCVNGSPHNNPDKTRVSGTHWHIYSEEYEDRYAVEASLSSDDFIDSTVALLERFHVVEKPQFQGGLL